MFQTTTNKGARSNNPLLFTTGMYQEVCKWLVSGLKPSYKWGILGIGGYNPLTNHLLTSWDIQVPFLKGCDIKKSAKASQLPSKYSQLLCQRTAWHQWFLLTNTWGTKSRRDPQIIYQVLKEWIYTATHPKPFDGLIGHPEDNFW